MWFVFSVSSCFVCCRFLIYKVGIVVMVDLQMKYQLFGSFRCSFSFCFVVSQKTITIIKLKHVIYGCSYSLTVIQLNRDFFFFCFMALLVRED